MNRRRFLHGASALSLASAVASSSRAFATETLAAASAFDPTEASVATLQQAMAAGRLTAAALTTAYLERIARLDVAGPALNSVLARNPAALDAARTLDAERQAGTLRGPLHGIPLLLKDNIESLDPMPTTAGSRALAESFHATDAPLVARLRAAGAIVLGKTNLSEWANFRSSHSVSGWSGVGGQTKNAYGQHRNPSGSSSGSAAATAASFCAAAIGSETSGSILAPSSLQGLVGLKPTWGLISGAGIVPLSPRQDTAGYGAQGPDLETFRLQGVRIGVMPVPKGAHPEVAALYRSARDVFAREGAVLIDLESPHSLDEASEAELEGLLYDFKDAINRYLLRLDPARIRSRSLADLIAFNTADRVELSVFGQDLFEQAEAHGPLTDKAYLKTLRTLRRCADTEGLAALFSRSRTELLLAPGNGPAAPIDNVWGDRGDDGWPPIASGAAIAGYPSITVPAGLIRNLPVGIVLVAPRFQDGLLLQGARAFERAAALRVPPRMGG
jgi:amidase